ncbi:hypothetical protein [Spirosoma daeguense]
MNWSAILLLMFLSIVTQAQSVTYRYPSKAKRPTPRVAYVSVCESRSAYAYHSGMCRGLARCTHGVSQVSVAQARTSGYVPCKICY